MTSDQDDRPRPEVLVEACIASVNDARAALRGGADRLELNRDLHRDGLTPRFSLFETVRDAIDLPVIVMIRPHDDGFVYSASDFTTMSRDVERFVDGGAAGVALGPLRADGGGVDTEQLRQLVDVAGVAEVVFHRAFDRVRDMASTLEKLIEVGVTRVLTSGQAATACEGIPALATLVETAAGRIEILPGAGVGPGNAGDIISGTGCTQLHGTFRDPATPGGGTDAATVARVRAAAAAALSRGLPREP